MSAPKVPDKVLLVKQWIQEHFPHVKITERDMATDGPWFILFEGNKEAEIDFNRPIYRGSPPWASTSTPPPDWFFIDTDNLTQPIAKCIKAYISEPDYFEKLTDALKKSGLTYKP
jgi:hypothetical protein